MGVPERGDYLAQFRRHCHELIAFAHSRIRDEGHCESDEDFITQRLKESIQAGQRAGSLPRWADRYHVADQAPIGAPGRSGKDRPKIDIEIESSETRTRPVFHFEAKRLRSDDSHSVSAYLGPAGLGSFLDELYGRAGGEGGMLGYVQSDSPKRWAEKIAAKMQAGGKEGYRFTDDGAWIATRLAPELPHTYATRHHRPTLCNIAIYHTLLDFRKR